MSYGRIVACSLILAGAGLMNASLAAQAEKGKPQPGGIVALTFDDLPAHGPLPPGVTRIDVARSIIEALQSRHAPAAYGFVNAKLVDEQPSDAEVLRIWNGARFPLGNHTFSHMDLNANPLDAFEQDVMAGEPLVKSLMGDADWHWLRFPFLHEGDTLEKHNAVMTFLANRGYKIAEVTISFDDYAYNEPYARCRSKNDAENVKWLEESYLSRAAESLTRGQNASRSIFGRDIKHIMLLHVGAFQTVMFPRLLDLLQQRGWTLTTLPDAAADPAYARAAEGRTSWTGTFLDHFRAARDIPPPGPSAVNVFQQLASLCK